VEAPFVRWAGGEFVNLASRAMVTPPDLQRHARRMTRCLRGAGRTATRPACAGSHHPEPAPAPPKTDIFVQSFRKITSVPELVAHDLDPLVATFGDNAEWHNKTGGNILRGHGAIREFYAALFRGFPDFDIVVHQTHIAEEAIVLETDISGTHLGDYMGMPATGQRIRVPLCAIFTFTADGRVKEIVHYDQLSGRSASNCSRRINIPLRRASHDLGLRKSGGSDVVAADRPGHALRLADEGVGIAICARGEAALREIEAQLRTKSVPVHAKSAT
jgi:steroid delta-isomerase-like uncharacterized protein